MPAKKKTARKSKPRKKAAPSQIDSLRRIITDLRKRLERELKTRKIDTRLVSEGKKAREQLGKQVQALREQGSKLSAQLKSALGDSKQREKARQDAVKRIEQLRKELGQKTSELLHKSEQLKELAAQSASRAVEIIRGEAPAAEPPREAPSNYSEPSPSSSAGEGGSDFSGPDDGSKEQPR
jgi:chromosome segregation ATPase